MFKRLMVKMLIKCFTTKEILFFIFVYSNLLSSLSDTEVIKPPSYNRGLFRSRTRMFHIGEAVSGGRVPGCARRIRDATSINRRPVIG